jgi:uncharacterized protein YndB with AHSA1/START domain
VAAASSLTAAALAGAALAWLPAAGAADIEEVAVARDGDRYSVAMTVVLAAPADAVYAAMTDFEALPRINPNIVLSETDDDGRLHTLVELCVAFFCRKVEQWQTVTTDAPHRLNMTVLPERSDLRYGEAEWTFVALTPATSRMRFRTEIVPDFWVPPVIGPWIIQRKLHEQAVITAKGLERAAEKSVHSGR